MALTQRLNEQQLKQNIDALIKGGMPTAKVQEYVNNYRKDQDGSYSLSSSQPTEQPAPMETAPMPKPKVFAEKGASGFLNLGNTIGKIGNALSSSEQAFGDTLGQAVGAMDKGVTSKIDEANKLHIETGQKWAQMAHSVTDLAKKQDYINKANENFKAAGSTYQEVLPAIEKTNTQIAGEAAGVGLDVLTAGTYGEAAKGMKAGQLATKSGKVLPTIAKEAIKPSSLLKGALKGGAEGAVIGGAYGAAGAAQSGENIGQGALSGAMTGGALGGIAGGAGAKIGQRVENKAINKSKTLDLLNKGIPESSVATKTLDLKGNIIKDKVAKAAVKQGIPEADVALIKTSSATDKAKMAKMLDIRESQLTNRKITDRASDVVGNTVMNVAKHIQTTNKNAGTQLNEIAKGLKGKPVDIQPAIESFTKQIDEAGITIGEKGKLDFTNSDFEGVPSAEKALQGIWTRVQKVYETGDASEVHNMKNYIDEVVNYGKQTGGLSGRAERMLKGLRHDADTVLDSSFPEYDKVNQVYGETIGELHNIGDILGKKFKIGDNFADAKLGTSLRGILSNNQSRANILKSLETMQAVAKKHGLKIDEDIIGQANFADLLERHLGTEAPTSFQGGIEKAINATSGMAGDLYKGNVVGAGIKGAKMAIDKTRGITQENKIASLRKLLGIEGKKKLLSPTNEKLYGGIAGVQVDDNGNVSYSPEKGAMGMMGMVAGKKVAGMAEKGKLGGLLDEAKKYKSAEEFVKGQTNAYHGTNKPFSSFELTKGQRTGFLGGKETVDNQAIFLSSNKDVANFYGSNRAYVNGGNARIIEASIPKENILDLSGKLPSNIKNKALDLIQKWEGGIRKTNIPVSRQTWLIDQPDFVALLKTQGYKGAKFNEGAILKSDKYTLKTKGGNYTTAIFDPKDILTKSQLTDIWNKAQEKSVGRSAGAEAKTTDSLIQEAKKYKSAEEFVKGQTKQDYRSAHQLGLSDSITADKIDIPTLKEQIRTRNGYLNNYNISDLKKLEKLQNNPEAEITIYRASPKNGLNDGDWVTTDKTYANDIKKQNGGKVYPYTVKVKDLRFPKDSETLPSLSMASTFSYSPKTSQLTDIWNKANKK